MFNIYDTKIKTVENYCTYTRELYLAKIAKNLISLKYTTNFKLM
jgi:hypothetical protein